MTKPCEHCLIEIHRNEGGLIERYAERKDGFIIIERKKGDPIWEDEPETYKKTFYVLESRCGDSYMDVGADIHYCPWCGRKLDGDT